MDRAIFSGVAADCRRSWGERSGGIKEAVVPIVRVILALAYIACYHWSYAAYVNPTWEYGHYYYFDRDTTQYLIFYFLALLPVAFYRRSCAPANLGAILIYLLSYAPGQLTILFMWTGNATTLYALGVMLGVGMCAIFAIASVPFAIFMSDKTTPAPPQSFGSVAKFLMLAFSIGSLVVLISENLGHMRLVSFYDVYELRAEAGRASSGGLAGYLVMWLSLFVIPFYAVRGLVERKYWPFMLAVGMALLVYMANGAKIALLMPFVVLAMYILYTAKGDMFIKLCLSLLLVLVVLMSIDQELFNFAKAILIARTLSVGGWTIAIYYEYFVARELTYFGHIGVVDSIFSNYPYGSYSLGQMIGINYSGSSEANFNAGFWASDGIAAVGPVGLILVSIMVALFLVFLNAVSASFDQTFIALWLTGFWVTLMNAPLTTSLLSGGGLLMVAFLMFSRLESLFFVRWNVALKDKGRRV